MTSLEKLFPSAAQIAPEIVAAVASNDYAVCDKRLDPQVILAIGRASAPKCGLGVVDTLLSILMFFVFPLIRRDVEKTSLGDSWETPHQ